jgi:dTDP-glucose 4,6-dehydratase
VEGILRLLDSDEHFPVNIGNPREITILEFAERIRALTGARGELIFRPLPQDDPKRRRPDISKAKDLLKWEPKVALEKGLQITLEYFQKKFASEHAVSS